MQTVHVSRSQGADHLAAQLRAHLQNSAWHNEGRSIAGQLEGATYSERQVFHFHVHLDARWDGGVGTMDYLAIAAAADSADPASDMELTITELTARLSLPKPGNPCDIVKMMGHCIVKNALPSPSYPGEVVNAFKDRLLQALKEQL